MALRQRGQREPGETMEIPSGMREMQTFRKLPMQMPNRKKKKGITALNVPQARTRLNAHGGWACRMANQEDGQVRDEGENIQAFGRKAPVRYTVYVWQ